MRKLFLVDQKFPETGQFFYWSTKKNEKKTEQLVDQVTDQNHMDGAFIFGIPKFFLVDQKNEKLTKQLVYQRD